MLLSGKRGPGQGTTSVYNGCHEHAHALVYGPFTVMISVLMSVLQQVVEVLNTTVSCRSDTVLDVRCLASV